MYCKLRSPWVEVIKREGYLGVSLVISKARVPPSGKIGERYVKYFGGQNVFSEAGIPACREGRIVRVGVRRKVESGSVPDVPPHR